MKKTISFCHVMQNVKDINLRTAHFSVLLSNIPSSPTQLSSSTFTWKSNFTAYLASDSIGVFAQLGFWLGY